MSDFWIPRRKYELVKWLEDYYGKSFKSKSKAQLMAIYLNARKGK